MSESTSESSRFSLPKIEQEVLRHWEQHDVFRASLEQTKFGTPYAFYDGPPFATGLPHHGNLLASVLKDVVPRYWTMKGFHVQRRFGWDCHGVPIEYEIDKKLGMPTHQAVQKLGVAGYSSECRGIVERYVKEWRAIIERLGRWVDFDNDYKTMDAWYMESVWWVLKQLWNKDLVYQGEKVMPVSTVLETPLSNFEASSNFQEVQDPSVTVLFKLIDEDAYVAAWTTTPWTLPSNLALCVGAEISYVKVVDLSSDRDIWLAKDRLPPYQERHDFEVIEEAVGADLVGRSYEPLFPYFSSDRSRGAFLIVADDYVTIEEGTGIVHQAPAFGEDDYRIAKREGMPIDRCPVSMDGRFLQSVSDFAGQYIKDADKNIIAWLQVKGCLLETGVIVHRYPFCWRSGTPLIYRTVPTWFVRVSEMREALATANEQVHWVPDHIKHGRFGDWISNAIDWAISRNRIWGTPLPIWRNDATGRFVCIGSREELQNLTGVWVEDLHREFVDELNFEVEGEPGTFRRIPEVLDCWFESGSMPYAHRHYPFENKESFDAGFPAEFIAEGLDQTRGWFYTLMVLSVGIFGVSAFKNVIVNGMVLAEDGKKMSKSLKNYTPPEILINTYGADALRLYLINSGLLRGVEQRFADSGVREMARRALLPWYNAYSFLNIYANADGWKPEKQFLESENVLDRWILSRLQSLKAEIRREMELYHLYNVVPQLFTFIEELTNWYIRLNRARFWGEQLSGDKLSAFSTLYVALYDLTLAMAPYAPFLSEHIYQGLMKFKDADSHPNSVHLCSYPEVAEELCDHKLEATVERMQRILLLGRKRREEERVSLRTPLPSLVVIHRDERILNEIQELEETIKTELNVKHIGYDTHESNYIQLKAKPNFPILGKRLGKRMRAFHEQICRLSPQTIKELQHNGEIAIDGEVFSDSDILVAQLAREGSNVVSDSFISISFACEPTEENLLEGLSREVVNRIQRTRKELELNVSDRIQVVYQGTDRLLAALAKHSQYIARETLAVKFEQGNASQHAVDIDGECFRFDIAVSKRPAQGERSINFNC